MVAAESLDGCQSTLSDLSRGMRSRTRAIPYFLAFASLFFSNAAHAQLQQNFIYTTGGAIAIRNDTNGTLAPVNGSPLFPLGFPAVLDAKGRFLFAAGNDSIHMYTVDSTTGLYGEVNGSPFASANTNGPILLATEPTGTYLAVVNSAGLNPGESSVESFLIDPSAETLTPVTGSFLKLVSSPVGAASNPALGKFFVYLGPNPSSSNLFYQQDGDLLTYAIDPQTGLLGAETGADGGNNSHGRSFGADPIGRFVVNGQGQFSGTLQLTSATGVQSILDTGSGVYPQEIFVGPGQHFVYATLSTPPTTAVHIYIVDTTTWTLTEAPSSPLPGFTSVSNLVADPTGQFVYASTAPNQTRVYSVDPSTGYFSEISNSPFTAVGLGLPIAFSVDPNSIQKEVGPVATLTPRTLSLGASNIGVSAMAQVVTLSSTGDQGLTVNAIIVTGANASEFGELDDCAVPTVLAPPHSCSISILFTPAAFGPRQAQLTVTDNAPGSPQSVTLTGTGNGTPPPAPAITFVPGTMNFPATNKVSSSAPSSVTVTNSGNAPLTISSILLGGKNPADFSAPPPTASALPSRLATPAPSLKSSRPPLKAHVKPRSPSPTTPQAARTPSISPAPDSPPTAPARSCASRPPPSIFRRSRKASRASPPASPSIIPAAPHCTSPAFPLAATVPPTSPTPSPLAPTPLSRPTPPAPSPSPSRRSLPARAVKLSP